MRNHPYPIRNLANHDTSGPHFSLVLGMTRTARGPCGKRCLVRALLSGRRRRRRVSGRGILKKGQYTVIRV